MVLKLWGTSVSKPYSVGEFGSSTFILREREVTKYTYEAAIATVLLNFLKEFFLQANSLRFFRMTDCTKPQTYPQGRVIYRIFQTIQSLARYK